jgi:hypothetical protein
MLLMLKPRLQAIMQRQVNFCAAGPKLTMASSSKHVALVWWEQYATSHPENRDIAPPNRMLALPSRYPSSKKTKGMARVPVPRQMMIRLKMLELFEPGDTFLLMKRTGLPA